MPGANERALEKAKGIPADALILDLEDAVAPDAKADARDRVCAAATSGGYGAQGGDDPGQRARHPVARRRPRAPRPRPGPPPWWCPRSTRSTTSAPSSRASTPAAPRTTPTIWAMLETPVAMLHAEEIAAASERLAVLVMGTNDLAKELHAEHVPGRQPLLHGLVARPPRRPRRRQGDPRRRLQRHQGRRRVPGRVPPGPPARLRRQDAHPPQPGRAVQRRLGADRRRGRGGRSASSPPSRRRRPRARAWSPSTAA